MATIPSIPVPKGDVPSLQQSVMAIKQSMDTRLGPAKPTTPSAKAIAVGAAISHVIRLTP
jgi:hypothetical protein